MDSKTFFDIYIENEKYKTILNAQYVLVSSKIRLKNRYGIDNAITAVNTLYPSNNVFYRATSEDIRDAYFEQLEENLSLLASIALIGVKANIVFLCTKNEMKLKYMKHLVYFYKERLGIDVYDYREIVTGLVEYQKPDKKTLSRIDKIVKEKKILNREVLKKSRDGMMSIHNDLKNTSKNDLKKELKSRGLYIDGMNKNEMIEMLEAFL